LDVSQLDGLNEIWGALCLFRPIFIGSFATFANMFYIHSYYDA